MTSIANIWLKLRSCNLRNTNSDKYRFFFDALVLLTSTPSVVSILSKCSVFILVVIYMYFHLRKLVDNIYYFHENIYYLIFIIFIVWLSFLVRISFRVHVFIVWFYVSSFVIAESSIMLAKYFPFLQLHVAVFQTKSFSHTHQHLSLFHDLHFFP